MPSRSYFNIAFWIVLILFQIAGRMSYPMSRSWRISPQIGSLDDGFGYGFPFMHYSVWLGVPVETAIYWPEVIANIIVGIACSFIAGWAFNKYVRKNATGNRTDLT